MTYRGHRGARGLRRAHQHQRQHPQRGQDPPPRDPVARGRPLHAAEAEPRAPAPRQPRATSRASTSPPSPGTDKTQDHRERRGHRAAHRASSASAAATRRSTASSAPSTSPRTTSWAAAGRSSIRIRAGGQTQQGTISFTEPWLFDRPLVGGLRPLQRPARLRRLRRTHSLGGDLRLSQPFEEYWRCAGVLPALAGTPSATSGRRGRPTLQAQEGTTITSAIIAGAHPRQPRQRPDADQGWPDRDHRRLRRPRRRHRSSSRLVASATTSTRSG